jgi:hypothetical protein
MNLSFKKYYPLFVSLIILWIIFVTMSAISYYRNDHHVVYSLDDAYIHLSMAKNLIEYGVWGVTRYGFASCSSSIIWTALVAGIYYLTGAKEIIPLILNLLFASLTLITSFYILKRFGITPLESLFILIAVIIFSPLPPIMFTGMEHVMHVWFTLVFIYFVSIVISDESGNNRNYFILLLVSFCLPSVRYEGFLAVFAGVLMFLLNGKWVKGLLVMIVSVVPVTVFGLISIRNGWSFFPNSMTIRWNFAEILTLEDFYKFLKIFAVYMFAKFEVVIFSLILISIVILVLIRFRGNLSKILKNELTTIIVIYTANFVLFAAYSRSGFSFRYQIFLAVLGILFGSIIFIRYVVPLMNRKSTIRTVIIILLVGIPFLYFATGRIKLIFNTPQHSSNIYEQQYQMSKFIGQYYKGRNIALNDIGAVNYYNDIKCVDLAGLSTLEVSKLKNQYRFINYEINRLCLDKNTEIAILYDSWFIFDEESVIPPEWRNVGSWTISNNFVCGDTTISFYSIREEVPGTLIRNLQTFSPQLPEVVKQAGDYLK